MLESTFSSDGSRYSGVKYIYNTDKYLIQRIDSTNLIMSGGATYTVRYTQYTYDKNNYLIKSEATLNFYSKSGKQVQAPSKLFHTYTYNSKNQLVSDEYFGLGDYLASGSLTDTYEYSNGQISKAIINGAGEISTIVFQSGIPISYNSTSGNIYEINSQGFIKTVRFVDPINRSWITTYNYDDKQRPISIITIVDNGAPEKYLIEYDNKINPNLLIPQFKGFPNYNLYGNLPNNHLKETQEYSTTNITNYVYDYNSDGYPTKAKLVSSSGVPHEYLFTYKNCK